MHLNLGIGSNQVEASLLYAFRYSQTPLWGFKGCYKAIWVNNKHYQFFFRKGSSTPKEWNVSSMHKVSRYQGMEVLWLSREDITPDRYQNVLCKYKHLPRRRNSLLVWKLNTIANVRIRVERVIIGFLVLPNQ